MVWLLIAFMMYDFDNYRQDQLSIATRAPEPGRRQKQVTVIPDRR
jgi:hypothetical protein